MRPCRLGQPASHPVLKSEQSVGESLTDAYVPAGWRASLAGVHVVRKTRGTEERSRPERNVVTVRARHLSSHQLPLHPSGPLPSVTSLRTAGMPGCRIHRESFDF